MGQITTLPIATVAATKALLGLGNVDNTADVDKPISTAVQAALDGKRPASQPIALADLSQSGATAGQVLKWNGFAWAPGTDLVGEGGGGSGITTVFGRTGPDIVPEAGDYSFAQIGQKPTTLTGYGITDATPSSHIGAGGAQHSAATTSVAGFMAAADKLKLDSVATGATANSPDATLLDRSNHTGVQPISTVNGLQGQLDGLAPKNNPIFTGTVAGITKAMVGLSNADNTSDVAKPVSTAQAAAIALRNAGIQWQNQGTNLGAAATVDTVNAGSGLVASRNGNVITLTSTGAAQNSLTPASSTVPPTVDAVVLGLADKANSSDVTQTIDNLQNTLGAQIASKENALTFLGATREGNVVSVDPAVVGGSLLDGKSWYVLPGPTGFTTPGITGTANPTGTYSLRNPVGASQNAWNTLGRSQLQAAAATGNHARLYNVPAARWATDNSPYYGFKITGTFAAADALTGAMGFFGVIQHNNLPAIGTAPSAYTGNRFGFVYNPGDSTLSVYWNTTLIKSLGASFPCHGNETNPYDWLIESIPNASAQRTLRWSIKHRLTGASDGGTLVGQGPQGDHEINVLYVRDSNGSATQATFTTTGHTGGAFTSLVIGERLDIPTPVPIAGDATLTRVAHANVDLLVESATPVTLTVKNSGYIHGDKLAGQNDGAGAITFVGEGGFTIQRHPDLPATVEQWQGFTLSYNGVANRWVRVA